MDKPILTADYLRNMLTYEPDTGVFRYTVKRGVNAAAGQEAGCVKGNKYRKIQILGKNYYAHRLAFLHVTGEWPVHLVDHKNNDHLDNRWSNLRQADHISNAENLQEPHRDNPTGLLGVSKVGLKFRAQIMTKGRKIDLGCYASPEMAHTVYVKAKRQLHGGNML